MTGPCDRIDLRRARKGSKVLKDFKFEKHVDPWSPAKRGNEVFVSRRSFQTLTVLVALFFELRFACRKREPARAFGTFPASMLNIDNNKKEGILVDVTHLLQHAESLDTF